MTVKKIIPKGFKELRTALKKQLGASKVNFEPVPKSKLFRVVVVADRFKRVPQLKRLDRIWDVVDNKLQPESKLRISLVFAFTSDELMD